MIIYKEFIDQIIKKRETSLNELVNKDGLCLKSKAKNVEDLIDPLDRIFYTIDFLRKEGLIEYEKAYNVSDSLFELPFGKDIQKIHAMMYLSDLWKDAAGWKIKIKPGLIHFKEQGYQTDAQLKERRQFLLTIGVALGVSIITSILTALLIKMPVINCWAIH